MTKRDLRWNLVSQQSTILQDRGLFYLLAKSQVYLEREIKGYQGMNCSNVAANARSWNRLQFLICCLNSRQDKHLFAQLH